MTVFSVVALRLVSFDSVSQAYCQTRANLPRASNKLVMQISLAHDFISWFVSSQFSAGSFLQFTCKSIVICITGVYHGGIMLAPSKSIRYRRLLSGLLLSVYAAAGVLGYGLHAVWDCDHHCHVHSHESGMVHSHPHVHGHKCNHHHYHGPVIAGHSENRAALVLVADDCPICNFLVQAQSSFVLEFTTVCAGPSFPLSIPLGSAYVAPLSGFSSARGPPLG